MFLPCLTLPLATQYAQVTTARARQSRKDVSWLRMSAVTSVRKQREVQTKNSRYSEEDAPTSGKTESFEDVKLILAPMEVLADRQFRQAIATIGGMDEAVHEFIRITHPKLEDIRGVLRQRYNAKEMGSIPLAAQIMGGDPAAMEMATAELVHRYGAHRVDLNCGCPAKKVNGRGGGASLLRTPEVIYEITKRMVDAVGDCSSIVSVKMRSGYDSTTLFDENIHAIVEAGARMLTVHPRTKTQAYAGSADWEFIKTAKEICGNRVDVVGNGDVITAKDALRILDDTGCDHVMVGRGAVANPWIFWDIRKEFAERCGGGEDNLSIGRRHPEERTLESERKFYESYFRSSGDVTDRSSPKTHKLKIGRLKMVIGYSSTIPDEAKQSLLRSDGGGDARVYLKEVVDVISAQYERSPGYDRDAQLVGS